MMENDSLSNACALAIKHVPDFLLDHRQVDNDMVFRQEDSREIVAWDMGIVSYVLTSKPNLIPKLLKVISDSAVDTLPDIEMKNLNNLKPEAFSNAQKDIAEYCTKNDNGNYHVEPHYLLPIK